MTIKRTNHNQPAPTNEQPHAQPPAYEDALDQALRLELVLQAPPEVTARLLDLVPGASESQRLPAQTPIPAPDAAPMPHQPSRQMVHQTAADPEAAPDTPRTWYTTLVAVLTTLVLGLSLALAWRLYGIVGAELGLVSLWQSVAMLPDMLWTWVYTQLPAARPAAAAFAIVRDQLHWLFIAVVLWLALDGWSPRVALQRQQAPG